MIGDVFVYVISAFVLFFIGRYGHDAGWWGFNWYVFLFCSLAGLLFGMGVLNVAFPGLSFLKQLVISFATTAATVVFSLLLLKILQSRQ